MSFYRDTFIEIDLDAVYQNVTNLQQYFPQGQQIIAVIKADSYGHGAVMVARTLKEAGVTHFAVATLDEALELRKNGIQEPILLFGVTDVAFLDIVAKQHISISVHSLSWLKKALLQKRKAVEPIHVHIKIDTGMHRLGFTEESDLYSAVQMIGQSDLFQLKGVYTHLATSEEQNDSYYQMQVDHFEKMIAHLDKSALLIHVANSAGSLKTPPPFVNTVRIGLFINGICPAKNVQLPFTLRPSLSLHSKVILVKKVPAHAKISYNGIYETASEAWIGTVPIGYADGYDRRMINGQVYVDGELAKVVGRICMDLIMIELPHWVEEGTPVELIGPHISMDDYCEWVGTNNYHATCAFTDRLPRIYRRHGKIVRVVNRRLNGKV